MNNFKIGSLVKGRVGRDVLGLRRLCFFFEAGEDPFGASFWMEKDTVGLYLGSLDQNDSTHSSPYSKVLLEEKVILVKTSDISNL